jgi:hypothetical protein
LLRTTETRAIAIPLNDVVAAIALRFGGGIELEGRGAGTPASDYEVAIDPLVLERALGMLTEVLAAAPSTNDRAAVSVSVEQDDDAATAAAILRLDLHTRGVPGDDPFARVHANIALALSLKLLSDLGLPSVLTEHESNVSIRIALPLRVVTQDDARSTHSSRSRHSRETLPL